MSDLWCEGVGEFAFFHADEFQEFGGVKVHKAGRWHLLNGDVVEMQANDQPELVSGRPRVVLPGFGAALGRTHEVPLADLDLAVGSAHEE